MPLSAAFCFFSPFHYKKKLLYQSFSLINLFLSYLSFLFSSLSCQFSFNAYIRNLAYYIIKYNKKSGDLIVKSPLHINTLYIIIYLYEESLSDII